MNAGKQQRGRPKGSGINDQQRLADIARLIHSDPRMKPTTAIKALGVTDPSTIRRLRDKFNEQHQTSAVPPDFVEPASRPTNVSPIPRAAALKIAEPIKRIEAKPAPSLVESTTSACAAAPVQVRPKSPEPVPVAALLFGFGLNAATAFLEQQLMIAHSVMKLPQVRDLVRHQIAFTEFVLNFTEPSPGRRVVH